MAKIPISIITGFLGSGKTTLLSELLSVYAKDSIAVIVNEFGQAGLDSTILAQHIQYVQEEMIVLKGGCACCNRREDLIISLKHMLESYHQEGKKLEHILIETTGLANPAPILFSILTDPFLSQHFVTTSLITCIDSINGVQHITQNTEAKNQIISSDTIIITKTDLKPPSKPLLDSLASLNPAARVIDKSRLDFASLLDNSPMIAPSIPPAQTHKSNISSLVLSFTQPLDWSAFGIWLSMLLFAHGDCILRVKGIIDVGESYLVAINGVQHIIHPPTHLLLDAGQKRESELVFIAKDIPTSTIQHSFSTFMKLHPYHQTP